MAAQKELTRDYDKMLGKTMEMLLEEVRKEGRVGYRYSDKQRAVFLYFLTVKSMQAAPAARMAGVNESTAQGWARGLRDTPGFVFFKAQPVTPTVQDKPKVLTKKQFLLDFYEKYPEATAEDALEKLAEAFKEAEVKETSVTENEYNQIVKYSKAMQSEVCEIVPQQIDDRSNWVETWEAVGMNYMHNCVFIDEAVVAGTSVLGAVSARGVVNLGFKIPTVSSPSSAKETKKSHFMHFLKETMEKMDKHPSMEGNFIIMDNSPVHDKKDAKHIIESRGYKCAFLPPLSPELNPIESFWAVLKNKVKSSEFKDMKARISIAAFHEIHADVFQNIVQKSVDKMKK